MSTSVIETVNGTLQGKVREGVHVFRGIPYASPPVGPLRFKAPQPATACSGVRDATAFGPVACQLASPLEGMLAQQQQEMSEDCLTLNVWTPGADNGRRPVMVWIHGGAFVTGSGSTPWYRGDSFARTHDVVLVTINYRLGALGFAHLAEALGDDYAGSGNNGILDQVAALGWVRDNIALFGGDPANVTIFGESAGGMSVGTLLGTPAAGGLFQRAIPQSGARHHTLTPDAAGRVARRVLELLEVAPGDWDALQ